MEDLAEGHPVITREALESVAENAFTMLRGLVWLGGQVKVDVNLLMLGADHDGSPSSQVVSILRPAALAFLEVESSSAANSKLDRSSMEMDFWLSQKSFALTINAVAMLAVNRPVFFNEASAVLARRTMDPPTESGGGLSRTAAMAISSQLRASCLTLLRNALSVTTNSHEALVKALTDRNMKIQADKALSMAKQTAALKTAGRAARNRAAMFYEWDASESDKRVSKRQRETDDALAKLRAAKLARGLGNGIQLPASMTDSVELILANLTHLAPTRPTTGGKSSRTRKRPITFDSVVDAIVTNGSSLSQDEGRWYERDGGGCWKFDLEAPDESRYKLDDKTLFASELLHNKDAQSDKFKLADKEKDKFSELFASQCRAAASQAADRIWKTANQSHNKSLVQLGSQILSKLAWTLRGVEATGGLKIAQEMADESVAKVGTKFQHDGERRAKRLKTFVAEYPLVAACLTVDVTPTTTTKTTSTSTTTSAPTTTLANDVLNEAYLESCDFEDERGSDALAYDNALDVVAASVVYANDRANDKPGDAERKRIATVGAASLTKELSTLPYVPQSSLELVSRLCDIEEITKKAAEAARKTAQQTIATSAAIHAAKLAAEKRATASLVALRDVAFQRSNEQTRRAAINCAVAIAAGQIPASSSIEDKALKLVMNVLFPKSDVHSSMVLEGANTVLERAADFAIENHDAVQEANRNASTQQRSDRLEPVSSDEEKVAMEKVKKPALLFMALCVRRPEMIKHLMEACSKPKANILAKAVRENMPKLARAAATKHGAASIALRVAEMAEDTEASMLLAFLDSLTPAGDKNIPAQELIDACHKIQETKLTPDGKKDPRFIIPVVTGMKRVDLVKKLHEFVAAEDKIFMAALVNMASRLARHALVYREEPDAENPVLTGMTLCEQLVFLHKMDFTAEGIPQKRYLDAIRLCLEDEEVFTDTVVREALDYISGVFLTEDVNLPLAYMRTIILTCSKHESLHNWICHILLPRLIDGKVYTDRRQWEGWMRCARMLEKTGVDGVREAIEKLPEEQYELYRTKYPETR